MKRVISVYIHFLLTLKILGAQDQNKVFEKVELDANTNQKAWMEHISKRTQLPDSIIKNIPAGMYKVNVEFVIDVHGNVGQIKAKNDPGFGLAERAINALSSYKGEWKPANQCGRNVKAYKVQIITFVISSE